METALELPKNFPFSSILHVQKQGGGCPLQWIPTKAPECQCHCPGMSHDLTFRSSPGWKSGLGRTYKRLAWEHSGVVC